MNIQELIEIWQKLVSKFVMFRWPVIIELDEQNF